MGSPKAGAPNLSTERGHPSPALEKLRAGEITLEEYLEDRVENALLHVKGLLPAEQVDAIRSVLRDRLAHDPATLELVRRVTKLDPSKHSTASWAGHSC